MKVLIVDDEIHIRDLICKYAKYEGIETDTAEDGQVALQKVKEQQYSLVVMDIMMPNLDGFSCVKMMRKFTNVPVIMLSARSEEYDKIYGFDLGIDDYVTKPFSPKELILRMKAVINRYERPLQEALKTLEKIKNEFVYLTLKIDLDAYTVFIDDVKIDLTRKEYVLLVTLIENIGKVVKREDLLKTVWGDDFDGDDRTLDTHIKSLRKKMLTYGNNIVTLRRVGYRFEKDH